MEEREDEDLEAFTNILRNRYYNSGYREGLFKGKSEVIQDGFDRGYRVGALYSALKVIQEAFEQSQSENGENFDECEGDEIEVVKEIEKIRNGLEEGIPVIKIASSLFK